MKQYAALGETVYFWFAANDTSGSGGDGANPAADVRLAGAAAGAAPVYSPTPILLSHANYPAGAHEVAIAATAGNGFAANNTYAVFCTLAIDTQNPTGFVGSFDLKPVDANVTQLLDTAWLTPGVAGTPDVNAKLLGGTAQTGNDVGADVNEILIDTGTTLDALIKDIPTVAEFNARSILSADYLVVADTIAGVTAVTNDVGITQAGADKVWGTAVRAITDKAGFALSAAGITSIWQNDISAFAGAGHAGTYLKNLYDNQGNWNTAVGFSTHTAANVWAVGARTLTDKSNFALSTAAILAIWHQLTANIVTANTIGKLLKDDINATISSRSSHSANDARDAILDDATRFSGADVGAILTDTCEIGVAGASLTGLGGMSIGMKAEIESECNNALVSLKLDHLIAVADVDEPVNDSIIAKLAATNGDWSNFAKATDSLQSIRDVAPHGSAMVGTNNAALAATALSTVQWTNLRAGYQDNINNVNLSTIADISTLTAIEIAHLNADITSRSSHTAANVWGVAVRALTDKAGFSLAAAQTVQLNAQGKIDVKGEADSALSDIDLDHFIKVSAGAEEPIDGAYLDQIMHKAAGQTFDSTKDSLEAIRDRGDTHWITGGAGSITDILNVQPLIPLSIDLADIVTARMGLGLTNMLDDLPTTAEITPGTITIDRKAYGGTSWTNIVNAVACSEVAGLVYYDEVFDSGTGYAAGDTIRITFKNQKIIVAANDYEITGTDGWIFYTYIRESGGGDATSTNQTTIINHLSDIKGTSFVKDTHSLINIYNAAKKVFIGVGKP